jgi:hypothetical protein
MRHVIKTNSLVAAVTAAIVLNTSGGILAQGKPSSSALVPVPKVVTMAQMQDIAKMGGQLVQIDRAVVRHSDTAQLFTFGEAKGPETHVVVPGPAIDAAHVGDSVALIGLVRHYDPKSFERDFRWFRQADYPDIHSGDWVIVATSVRTAEGTELVPGNTISNTPAESPKIKPSRN